MADLELARGRENEAEVAARTQLPEDLAQRNDTAVANEYAILAEIKASQSSSTELVKYSAQIARITGLLPHHLYRMCLALFDVSRESDAAQVRTRLVNSRNAQAPSYLALLDAEIAVRRRSVDARSLLDHIKEQKGNWWTRFRLGQLYVRMGQYVTARELFEWCRTNVAQSAAVSLDDVPTVRFASALPYWIAKTHESAGDVEAAHRSYEEFIKFRAGAHDVLTIEAVERLKTPSR